METIDPSTKLGRILGWIQQTGASDLHGQEGKPFRYRREGRLELLPAEGVGESGGFEFHALIDEAFSQSTARAIHEAQQLDLSVTLESARFRVNCSKQQGRQSVSFRIVPKQTGTLDDLQLPDSLRDLLKHPRGVVIITGPTGQGKSTTARALIEEINLHQGVRIITIEDPVEFIFEDKQAQFEQREVGVDTESFAAGIRNAMRQDPNVLFIGELRDPESIFSAMQAAETGHLVLTTLHADTVPQAIGRLREYYPADQRDSISSLLGRNLNSIICQRLVPNVGGGRTPCLEILRRDAGVQEAIVNHNLSLLTGIMEVSNHQGMHTFDQYLVELLAAGVITEETAKYYATQPHKIELLIRGVHTHSAILKPDAGR
jgi:twitching motility protein PilT